MELTNEPNSKRDMEKNEAFVRKEMEKKALSVGKSMKKKESLVRMDTKKIVGAMGYFFIKNKGACMFALLSAMAASAAFMIATQAFPNLGLLTRNFTVNYVQEHAEFMTSEKIKDIAELELAANASVEEAFIRDILLDDGSAFRLLGKNERINLAAIIEGEKLEKNGHMLLNSTFAQAKGLKPGDDIKISGESYRISGLMALPHYVYPFEPGDGEVLTSNSLGLGVISDEDFEKIGAEKYLYSVYFADIDTENPENIKKLSESFRDKLSDREIKFSNWQDIGDNEHFTPIAELIDELGKLGLILAIAPILTACALWLFFVGRAEFSAGFLIVSVFSALAGGILGTLIGLASVHPVLDALTASYDLPLIDSQINFRYALAAAIAPAVFMGILCHPALRRFIIFPAHNKYTCMSFFSCRPF